MFASIKALPLGQGIRIRDIKIDTIIDEIMTLGRYSQSFIKCMVRGKPILPLHAMRINNLTMFPHFTNWTERTLYMPEIQLGLKVGYEYKFIEGFYFKHNDKSLGKLNKFLYEKRHEYPKDSALHFVFKLLGNSLYGCFGFNSLNKSTLKISNKKSNTWKKYLANGILLNRCEIGNYEINDIISYANPDKNFAIAAAITSYGRIHLYNIMLDIIKQRGNIYYTDTDSVLTNLKLEDYSDLVKKYHIGEKVLGGLKNETPEGCNETYIIGNKKYVLLNNNTTIKVSFNGIKYNPKVDKELLDDIKKNILIDIYNNKPIERVQNYFIANKNLYLSSYNPFDVKWIDVVITFNTENILNKISNIPIYLQKYKKGSIQDSDKLYYNIKPYEI